MGIAGLRSKEESREKQFVQGMEKLIDAMQGEIYSLLLIADPVLPEQIQLVKQGYEALYTELSPFAGHDLNFGENESQSVSDSITQGTTDTINKSISNTLSYTKGTNKSKNEGASDSVNVGVNASYNASVNAGVSVGVPGVASANAGVSSGYSVGVSAGYTHGWTRGTSWGTSDSNTRSKATTEGASVSTSKQEGKTDTTGKGSSRSLQIKIENKAVKDILEKIDLHLKRLNTSADTGMWNCSVYCLADDAPVCKIVASAYQSLLRGENSSVETGVITEWIHDEKIIPWLEKMHHPQLRLGDNSITPTSFISSAELTIHAGLPQTSVSGLPVASIAPFGREVSVHWESKRKKQEEETAIRLGSIYHMGKAEKLPVALIKNSLNSHTFITGSTGSGKSNTVYQLLNELRKTGAHFMVIEPAKGEYKNVFGVETTVDIYGTNPEVSPLLRINPFKFPKQIHILEHLDRLVEIFNVCWPMYAAMPAVLKDAIEESYREAGWDLERSINTFEQILYPSFADVVINIRKIIDSSEYSDENKGNYKGSLITRLKSLTNGINGMIFVNDELSAAELFDKDVIVDLSRVGSMETKALIMGLLVMKLQEYRMTSGRMNSGLQHVTVLEEAHNLLKRTSTEQSGESANLLGKSVEMLANAIAEMRTYGEGFIIADQSPGLLDMSAIRNTNTKIILRLPDQGDRELVGKAAGLNDDQITELAKLQLGIAAVYQNDWLQPVLCKVDYFATPEKMYSYTKQTSAQNMNGSKDLSDLKKQITLYLLSNMVKESDTKLSAINIDELKRHVLESRLEIFLKRKIGDYISKYKPAETIATISDIIAAMYTHRGEAINRIKQGFPVTNEWAKAFFDEITPSLADLNHATQRIIINCLIIELSRKDKLLYDLPQKWDNLGKEHTS
jgi:hypothetical protein